MKCISTPCISHLLTNSTLEGKGLSHQAVIHMMSTTPCIYLKPFTTQSQRLPLSQTNPGFYVSAVQIL